MVRISCMTCDMEIEANGVDEIWKALVHTHNIEMVRTKYGDEVAQIYADRLEREART